MGITLTNDVKAACGVSAYYTITNNELITSDTNLPFFSGLTSIKITNENIIKLEWALATDNLTPSSNIVYNVYMTLISGSYNFSNTYRSVTNATSTSISNIIIGQTYYFIVRAVDGTGNEDNNNIEKFVKISGTEDDFSKVKIYPNPGYKNEVLKIENLTEKGIIKIFTISGNLAGKIDFNSISGSVEINLNSLGLTSGMYIFIFISDGVEIMRYKFVFINKPRRNQ